MSEAVRLFTRLRQMFPGQPWQSGSSPGLRLPLPPQAARLPRAEPRTPEGPRPPARAGTPRRGPHPGRARPGRAGPVTLPVERYLGDLLRACGPGPIAELSSARVRAAARRSRSTCPPCPNWRRRVPRARGSSRSIPRNELLKDQLATALREVRGLRSAGSRSLVIGAYFGPTPFHSDLEPDTRAGWRRRGSSWICPFLTCPAAEQRRKLRRRARLGASS